MSRFTIRRVRKPRGIPGAVPRFFFAAAVWRAPDAERDLFFAGPASESLSRVASVHPESLSMTGAKGDESKQEKCLRP
jgi:hypothetical protein